MNDSWKKKLSDLTRKVGDQLKKQKFNISGEKLTQFFKNIAAKKDGHSNKKAPSNPLKRLNLTKLKELKLGQGAGAGKLSFLSDALLASENRHYWHKAFLICTLAVISWNAGKIPALMLGTLFDKKIDSETSPNLTINKIELSEFELLRQSDLFNAQGGKQVIEDKGPKIDIAKVKCENAEGRSSLPIKLLNTVVLQDEVKSVASVQIRTEQQEVRIGDEIDGIAKVEKIKRLQMVVKNLRNGACESIDNGEVDTSSPSAIQVMTKNEKKAWKSGLKQIKGIENNGNSYTISKSLINEQMQDIGTILTQAKGTPIQNPDGTMSFVISDVVAGGLFSYLGVQDGDVITSINGKKITDLNEVMNLFGTIKSLDNLQLTIDRGGMSSQFDYQFK